ncbi:2OG-Fe(II) oxygenase [Caballeronia sp. LZ062]|uniref:2OG-Fe(II) oxygenase n=1 Tax=unclassified Caballeronia TaxID=2646786 RepID=UPI00285B4D2F|nr:MULTISPECIES: 2OG-Fe(II) oxygenase [unclassified Caballeronia]MDR5853872.1 2OG-Fe(II) oxygenase [Caballeronia sp. LZ050]MDR5871597.1 2OG-Fe(II) oxygenase [Caballeronia sp. LZ062]
MSTLPRFDAAWKTWLDENILRGCAHQSLIDAMVAANFHPNTARLILARRLAGEAFDMPDAAAATDASAYVYGTPMLPPGRVLTASDCEAPKLFSFGQPVVALFADVLTHDECDRLIAIGRARVQRSSVVDPDSGNEVTITARQSEGAFVNASTDALVGTIDRRLAELFRQPVENGEDLHILRYGVGGEYRPHFDYFPEEQAGSRHHMQRGGQRVATIILYLNEVARGGDTTFPAVGLAIHPRRGSALYFEYVNELGQSDARTLHAGTPVEQGEKWIATKWVRRGRFRAEQ